MPTENNATESTPKVSEAMKIAIFPGSFDPFTKGHASIVERALPMFDHIVIGVGVNERKKPLYPPAERVGYIRALYAEEPKISVESYTDLTIDLARRVGARFIIRGLRSVKDFEYERDTAAMNHSARMLPSFYLKRNNHNETITDFTRAIVRFSADCHGTTSAGISRYRRQPIAQTANGAYGCHRIVRRYGKSKQTG